MAIVTPIDTLHKIKIAEAINKIDRDATVIHIRDGGLTTSRVAYWERRYIVLWERSSCPFKDRQYVVHYVHLDSNGDTMVHCGHYDMTLDRAMEVVAHKVTINTGAVA